MWLKDPKTKEESITVTIVVITLLIACIGAIVEFCGIGKAPNAAIDLFWGSLAGYVGRKFMVNGKSFNGDIKE